MRFSPSRPLVHALVCALVAAAVAGLYWLELAGYVRKTLLAWEYRYRDVVTATGRFTPRDDRLVFLAIDSASTSISALDLQGLYSGVAPESTEARALNIMAAGWPWSREIYALIAERLLNAGARVVVLDLLLPRAGNGDEALQAALETFRGRMILGSNFVPEVIGPGRESWALTLPSTTILPDVAPAHPAVGFVNFWPGFDGSVREVQHAASLDQLQGAATPTTATADTPRSLAWRAANAVGAAEPPDPFAPRLFRFTGPPGTFVPVPIYQIFVPDYWARNFGSGAAFRDRIVLIGPAGNWAHDEHSTPFGQMPGPELHLQSINALLNNAFPSELPRWSGYLLIGCTAAAAWLIAISVRRAWLRAGAFVLLAAAFLWAVKLAYDHLDIVVLASPPLLAFAVTGLLGFVYDFTQETLERLRVRRTLEEYVSADVVREVLDNPASYLNSLGGTRADVAVLMTDLRGFTSISETMDSTELVTQLNEYLSAMVDDIFAERGSVDKFIGDAVLAVWGHLNSSGPATDASRAVAAFLRMRSSLEKLNADWRARGMPSLQMGCGINFGDVVFGNIGSARKKDITVIGDTVNVAARLEGLTKQYGREILIGQSVADLVGEDYTLQFIDRVAVKGKSRALDLYSVIGRRADVVDADSAAYLDAYAQAQSAYRAREFEAASALFAKCREVRAEDRVASIYMQRCAEYAANPPPDDWAGIYIATEK